ncbi:MAG: DUF4296 domain-containing protein [Ginsengibacter sp.]
MKRISILMLVFIIISSCNNSNYIPPDVIKPVQMQTIMWDMIRGDLLAQEIVKKDSGQNIKSTGFTITEKILAIHNIDRTKFKKSMDFYERHPVLLKTIFDSLNAVQTRKNFLEIEKKEKPRKDHRFSPANQNHE